jgi:hypothetical protein
LTRSRGHYQAHQSGRIGFTFDDPYHRDQPGSVDERGAVASQLSHFAVELGTICPDFIKRRLDVPTDVLEKYLHNLYAVQPDFLYSVSRDFIRNCRTPMLVVSDDVPGHPLQTSIDVASLAPNAEITMFP